MGAPASMANEDEWHVIIIAKARMALNVANFIFLEHFPGFLSIILSALLQIIREVLPVVLLRLYCISCS